MTTHSPASPGAAHLESDPWLPLDTPFLGDIELVSGRLIVREVDWVQGSPACLAFARTFSSFRTGRDGPLGRGWTHAFEQAVEIGAGRLYLRESDGRMVGLGPALPLWGSARHPDGGTIVMRTSSGYALFSRGFRKTFIDAGEARARLHEIRTPDGFTTRFHYDAEGRLRAIEPPLARGAVELVYHPEHGRLVSLATTNEERIARYEYDAHGRLVEVGSGAVTAARYEYDAAHGMIRRRSPLGTRTYIPHLPGDSRQYRASEGPGSARVEVHVVPSALRSIVIDAAGHAASLRFDATRRTVGGTDPCGMTRRIERDPLLGLAVESHDRVGHSRQWLYDAQGFPAFLMGADGSSTSMEHDAAGRPTRVADPDGNSVRWAWDAGGALVAETTADGASHLYDYADDGRLMALITPSGCRVNVIASAPGRVEIDSPLGRRVALLDELGRIVQVIDEDGGPRWFGYDAAGRVHRSGSSELAMWTLTYSPGGRLSRAESPERTVEIARDAHDRVIGVIDGGERACLVREARGLVSALEGRTGARHVFVYDARGSMTEHRDPSGAITRLAYDAEQRIQSQTDALGKSRKVQRDSEGRIVRITHAGGDELAFEYDARGALTRADDGVTDVCFERDARSRVRRESCGDVDVESAFDAAGARVELRTSLGLHVHASADATGRTLRVALGPGGGSWELRRSFDGCGREREWSASGDVRVLLHRDVLGRVICRRVQQGGRELSRTEYTYAGGRLVRVADSRRGLVEYEYDAAGNLIVSDPQTGCDVRRGSNVSDDCGSPLLVTGPDGRVLHAHGSDFEHDPAGRRVSKTDAAGRLTRYGWDGAGRLVSVEAEGKPRVTYAYDPLGRLQTRTVAGVGEQAPERVRNFHWDGPRLVHEVEGAEVLSWIWMGDRPVGCFDGERTLTYLWDPRGTVSEVIDASGALVWSAEADPLGLTLAQDDSIPQPWYFDGHWYDRTTGLAMSLFRFWDPSTSSYLSPHPFGPAAGTCLYGIPVEPVPRFGGLGLAAGPNPHFGSAISPTLDRELTDLTLSALTLDMPRDPEPPWCSDPWAHFLGPLAPHFPSTRLNASGPWRTLKEPLVLPFLWPPDDPRSPRDEAR